jgi:hypothetical protein
VGSLVPILSKNPSAYGGAPNISIGWTTNNSTKSKASLLLREQQKLQNVSKPLVPSLNLNSLVDQ